MTDILVNIGALMCRLLVGGILLTAAVAKIRAGQSRFLSAILGYELVSKPVATVLARWLPWTEVITGGLLVVGFLTRPAVWVATALLLTFSAAIALSLVRGRNNECGCLGQLTPVQWRLIYRNLVLIGALIPVYIFNGGAWAVDTWVRSWSEPNKPTAIEVTALSVAWSALLILALLLHWFTRQKTMKSTSIP